MARQLYLELANFILRFGDRLVLLDRLQEIVLPAFVEQRQRHSRGSTYLFHDVRLINDPVGDRPSLAIAGRLVKNTSLRRKRIFDPDQGLITSDITIESAPASFFVLVLDGHKLLYVREDPGAPSIDVFATTTERFLSDAHEEYIDRLYREARAARAQGGPRVTKTQLVKATPKPSLEVIEIATEQTLIDFVSNFEKLKMARMRLVKTNDETDNDPFIIALRERQEAARSKATTFQHQNAEGLDKDAVAEQFKPAVDGNAKILLRGEDEDGREISGDNRQFKLKVGLTVEELEADVAVAARELIGVYRRLVQTGDVPLRDTTTAVSGQILSVVDRFRD